MHCCVPGELKTATNIAKISSSALSFLSLFLALVGPVTRAIISPRAFLDAMSDWPQLLTTVLCFFSFLFFNRLLCWYAVGPIIDFLNRANIGSILTDLITSKGYNFYNKDIDSKAQEEAASVGVARKASRKFLLPNNVDTQQLFCATRIDLSKPDNVIAWAMLRRVLYINLNAAMSKRLQVYVVITFWCSVGISCFIAFYQLFFNAESNKATGKDEEVLSFLESDYVVVRITKNNVIYLTMRTRALTLTRLTPSHY
jgi:hypothetical protein